MVQHISEAIAKDEGKLKQEVQRLFDDQTKLLAETQGTGGYYVPAVQFSRVCGVFVVVQSGYGAAVDLLGGQREVPKGKLSELLLESGDEFIVVKGHIGEHKGLFDDIGGAWDEMMEKLALGSPVASRPSTAANTRHSSYNDKEWKQKALQDLMCRFGDGQEAMTHGERTNRNLYRYLVNASPPNLDESKGDIDARFCTTHEDCKKALTETKNLIIAKDQQSYKWPLGKPPIQQFLAQWRDGPDLEVCVQIPSRSIDETSYEKLTIGELTQRFLADKASDDPVNALDIRSRSPNIYPRMLEPDSCRFLHLIIDASLSIKSAQRDAASTGEARQHKNLFEGSLVGQRGSNTDVHLDANGFATWITPQDGEFGFIWLTRLTADDMEGWIKDRSYDKDKVRYVVAKPGQTIFIPPGTPHGVVRLEDTLSITGHFLKWSDIDSWLRIMDLQREHPRITNEDMTKDSMLRLLEPALNIIQGRIERDDVEEMGGQDEAREIEEKAKVLILKIQKSKKGGKKRKRKT
ncbi:hypothetical protein FPOA_13424 [Fusarium poae]|uniref:JmjC domain-containing protein n=1 Tax=Fusarium poae TaxID=36050 RepID=A0A1B8A5Q3_FUSPO|nr:hypothetical protein FPOA_13424 [Fusarium poae]